MKKIYFTPHAKDRIYEYNLNYRQLRDNFKRAHRVFAPDYTMKINRVFHANKHMEYRWWNGVLFTIIQKHNTYIIMTVTPKFRETVIFW